MKIIVVEESELLNSANSLEDVVKNIFDKSSDMSTGESSASKNEDREEKLLNTFLELIMSLRECKSNEDTKGFETSDVPKTDKIDELRTQINGLSEMMKSLEYRFDQFVRDRRWIHVMRDLPRTAEHIQVFNSITNDVTHMNSLLQEIGQQLELYNKDLVGLRYLDDDRIKTLSDKTQDLTNQYREMGIRLTPIHKFILEKMTMLGLESDPEEETAPLCDGCGCCNCR